MFSSFKHSQHEAARSIRALPLVSQELKLRWQCTCAKCSTTQVHCRSQNKANFNAASRKSKGILMCGSIFLDKTVTPTLYGQFLFSTTPQKFLYDKEIYNLYAPPSCLSGKCMHFSISVYRQQNELPRTLAGHTPTFLECHFILSQPPTSTSSAKLKPTLQFFLMSKHVDS